MGNFGLFRDVGITDFVQQHIDANLILLFGIITQLGDIWFLVLLTGSLYLWGSNDSVVIESREQGAALLAIVFVYIGLSSLLKHALVLPRPPGAMIPPPIEVSHPLLRRVITSLTTATTPGFPSGHALGSTLVYGTLAIVSKYGTPRRRLLVAGSIIGAIGTTRLALGLHYAGDVITGFIIGLFCIPILLIVSQNGNKPTPVFFIAIVLGTIGLIPAFTMMSVSALGGGIGGAITWSRWHLTIREHTASELTTRYALMLPGGIILGSGLIYWILPELPGIFFASVFFVGGIISIPLLHQRITEYNTQNGT